MPNANCTWAGTERVYGLDSSVVSRMVSKNKNTLSGTKQKRLIDPTTLAVWFMDDGTKRTDCNAGRIATQGFTKKEQIQLK